MNVGLAVVLPLFFFFLIDLTLLINALRQRSHTNTVGIFFVLAGTVTIAQGLTAITYACDFNLIALPVWMQLYNLSALSGTVYYRSK